jgi:hypothetical protein
MAPSGIGGTGGVLDILFGPYSFLAPKDLKIIWFSNLLALSVPDEGYYRNVLCTLNVYIDVLIDANAI